MEKVDNVWTRCDILQKLTINGHIMGTSFNNKPLDFSRRDTNEEAGAFLRKIRTDKNLALEKIANRINKTKSFLSKVERGIRPVSVAVQEQLVSGYEMTDDEKFRFYSIINILPNDEKSFSKLLSIQKEHDDLLNNGEKYMNFNQNENKEIEVNVDPVKVPIFYTDSVFITANQDGVVFSVAQTVMEGKQNVITRFGMSRDHAVKLLKVLENQLKLTTKGKEQN